VPGQRRRAEALGRLLQERRRDLGDPAQQRLIEALRQVLEVRPLTRGAGVGGGGLDLVVDPGAEDELDASADEWLQPVDEVGVRSGEAGQLVAEALAVGFGVDLLRAVVGIDGDPLQAGIGGR